MMNDSLITFEKIDWHKGFYCENDLDKTLGKIMYTDFFEDPQNEDFPYYYADVLLRGSCQLFALSLNKILGYNIYIIEGKRGEGFHAFCQIHKNKKWFYVDERGITSSFGEFIEGIKIFVSDEYIIRPATHEDIEEWQEDDNFYEEGYAFAEAIINSYINYYTL